MRKLHEKSIVLGIGIGMIITSIAGMIYSAGTNQQPGKEEIIRMAKVYGLVDPAHIIKDAAAANSSAAATDTPGQNTDTAGRNITIVINDGDKSQQVIDQLLEKGVITSEDAFNKVLNSYDAATKINFGSFKFKKNEDLDYIVKTICNIK